VRSSLYLSLERVVESSLTPRPARRLQILTADNEWKHVPYIPDSIVVNTADILSFATAGYLKSTIHRVVRPPEDQAHVQRMGLFYFSRAAWDFPAGVVAPSPVLERLGLYKPNEQPVEPVSGLGASSLSLSRSPRTSLTL